MKVLQIYNRPLGGGGEEVVVRDIEKVAVASGEISTLYLDSSDWLAPGAPPKWKQAAWTIYNPQSARALHQLQEQRQSDAWLFHGIFPVGSPSLYHQALRDRIPIIQFIHNFRPFSISSYVRADDPEPFNQRLNHLYWDEIKTGAWQGSKLKTAVLGASLYALRKLNWLKAVKAWIATTNFMRDRFVEAGIPREEIFVLRYMWQPIAEPPLAAEGNYYLFLGRLMDDKGVRVLIEAWQIIRQKLGPAAPRLVIGGNGPLEHWVRQQSATNPSISFSGPVAGEQKAKLLTGCRALIAPSLCFESLGLVAYEAFDFAKPVLAARSGGLGETVQHGSTGLLHQPGNVTELTDQIIQLDASAHLRSQMGQNGRRWLFQQPSPEQWLRNFKQVVDYATARALAK